MKLSEALLRFARPLTDLLPPEATAEELERMLHVAYLVWNAVVLDELGHKSSYLAKARELVRANMKEPGRSAVLGMLTGMEKAKRGESAPDLRVIGEIKTHRGLDGGLQLQVSQVAPPADPKPPSGTWAELYAEARRFHSLAPWHWMEDSRIFGVRDPASGEVGWCCVLGAAEELFGLAVYRGDSGFDSYRRLHAGDLEREEAMFGQDAFLLAFVDRSDISRKELQRLRKLGLSFRGPGRWPQLESHATGRLPVPLDDVEAERMLHTLREALDVIVALREVPRWIDPDPEGRLLVRILRDGEWIAERVQPPPRIERPVPQFDSVRAERLKRGLKRVELELECDLNPAPVVVEERRGHPYAPAFFVLADRESGAVVHQKLGPPNEREQMAQAELMAGLEQLGARPATVRVKRRSLARAIAPLGSALGIEVKVVGELPVAERLQAALRMMMAEQSRSAGARSGRP